ncbi:shikimate dehydrogenase [Enterococcus rivorum]|uniref:Shikimate dehydrogenase (NADP(+)) n=1 Tax=Enterococcus rivorum TaxID=762845 RepID=A0A1E5KY32_9ENTE|nr:shikimate dehydrogenase [Enterococcus rivorum]MBP2099689.1 shikimate dehydrogenase [Enterococcus rivorum]OEH82714.1 shikimate dehydrogenase [Enterococcus rivorum]
MENKITGHTRLAALFATPIRHSVSPMIHNTAFQTLGIDAVYLAFEVGNGGLRAAVESIRNLEMMGANLSMPNKIQAVDYMDELSEAARLIGAINTITNENGKLTGHNTDGIGFMRSLEDIEVTPLGKKMTILGAGGAGTAITVQAALDGVEEIAIFNRKEQFFPKLQEKIARIAKSTGCKIKLHDLADTEQLALDVAESEVLLNATGVGMKPLENQAPIQNFSIIRPNMAVCDVIYTPRETKFLKEARLRGAKTNNGLGMLLYQGAAAFEKWTGQEMPIDKIKPIIESI